MPRLTPNAPFMPKHPPPPVLYTYYIYMVAKFSCIWLSAEPVFKAGRMIRRDARGIYKTFTMFLLCFDTYLSD